MNNIVTAEEAMARFIIGSIVSIHAATHSKETQPTLLFRILQTMYAIQLGVLGPVSWYVHELKEEVIGQFHKRYDLILFCKALEVLAYRGLVFKQDDGRWIITELGELVAYTLITEAKTIEEYRQYVKTSDSPNVLPLERPHTKVGRPHLRIVRND